jgi:hypothetical protein
MNWPWKTLVFVLSCRPTSHVIYKKNALRVRHLQLRLTITKFSFAISFPTSIKSFFFNFFLKKVWFFWKLNKVHHKSNNFISIFILKSFISIPLRILKYKKSSHWVSTFAQFALILKTSWFLTTGIRGQSINTIWLLSLLSCQPQTNVNSLVKLEKKLLAENSLFIVAVILLLERIEWVKNFNLNGTTEKAFCAILSPFCYYKTVFSFFLFTIKVI